MEGVRCRLEMMSAGQIVGKTRRMATTIEGVLCRDWQFNESGQSRNPDKGCLLELCANGSSIEAQCSDGCFRKVIVRQRLLSLRLYQRHTGQ